MADTVKIKKLKVAGEYVYPTSIIDAVKDPIQYLDEAKTKENPWYRKSVREILSFEQDQSKMEDGYTAEVMIGGLNKGTDVGGMTAEEVLDLILKPEYAPVYTAATAAITSTAATNGDVVEVGTKTPAESTYSSTGNKAKTAAGNSTSHVVYGGDATVTFSKDSATAGTDLTYDTTTTKEGVFTVKVTRAYAAGTDQVETNKGNKTNKTASNYTTLLANATANSNIASDNTIKATTKTATLTINYVYPVYASTATLGTLTKQSLSTSKSSCQYTLKGGAGDQTFAIKGTATSILEYNSVSGKYDINKLSGYETSQVTMTDAAGADVTYTKYVRKDKSGDDVKIQINYN